MNNKKKVVLLALLLVVTICSAVALFSADKVTISSPGVAMATYNVETGNINFRCDPVNKNDCGITIEPVQ